MTNLFENAGLDEGAYRPLADKLRPKSIEDVVGQDHILGSDAPLGRMLASGKMTSLILWGPPGTGKTTIARLLADHLDLAFEQISAIFSGVADLKKVFEAAKARRIGGRSTLLFVDEIHRFNRSQQDSFLPYVEDGTITLIGATTENPSFEINGALLSRMQVLILNRHDDAALEELLNRAEVEIGKSLLLNQAARTSLKAMADGDGRYLLNCVEILHDMGGDEPLDPDGLARLLQKRAPAYDKDREGHYNLISALHKSLRGSDADAALYWLARMLTGGEDPLYIVRRLVRFASEDIGMADPEAIHQAMAAKNVYEYLGSPEGELQIAQAVIYLATAPKSNAAYVAEKAAKSAARKTGSLMPPAHILNAPTKLMKDIGYGKGYAYDHDTEAGVSGQNYFPDDMKREEYYVPVERGFERDIKKRLEYFDRIRREYSNTHDE
ncbi:replication-associated recombination protein A [Kordiimonas sp. SCSIO 12610]|uniref:replication-associated recombination protein A n=1 Tax=Kordiimonas sp. SCSIO 12610 TaxID=2829597 RepID=UPI00210B5CF0|nr:replication-associated recombination protein A [Kordiimonas sp. SCSIO 12610]UTW54299.1 replication-associated recombination protein A [Kordiimonas sp. SCSIO 12610]